MAMERIPVIASVDDIPSAIAFGEANPSARWYVSRRATVLGCAGDLPESWRSTPLVASAVLEDSIISPSVELEGVEVGTDPTHALVAAMDSYAAAVIEFDHLKQRMSEIALTSDYDAFVAAAGYIAVNMEANDRIDSEELGDINEFISELEDSVSVTAGGIRRVRTPEGVEHFSDPIGNVINPAARLKPKFAIQIDDVTRAPNIVKAYAKGQNVVGWQIPDEGTHWGREIWYSRGQFFLRDRSSGGKTPWSTAASIGSPSARKITAPDAEKLIIGVATLASGILIDGEINPELETLLAAGVRRVRTPEGAEFYGQPIGSIIVPNVYLPAVPKMAKDLKPGDYVQRNGEKFRVQQVVPWNETTGLGAKKGQVGVTIRKEGGPAGEVTDVAVVTDGDREIPTFTSKPKGTKATLQDLDNDEIDLTKNADPLNEAPDDDVDEFKDVKKRPPAAVKTQEKAAEPDSFMTSVELSDTLGEIADQFRDAGDEDSGAVMDEIAKRIADGDSSEAQIDLEEFVSDFRKDDREGMGSMVYAALEDTRRFNTETAVPDVVAEHKAEQQAVLRRLELARPAELMTDAEQLAEMESLTDDYVNAVGPDADLKPFKDAVQARVLQLTKFQQDKRAAEEAAKKPAPKPEPAPVREKPVSAAEVDDTIRGIESGELSDADWAKMRPSLQDAVEKKMSGVAESAGSKSEAKSANVETTEPALGYDVEVSQNAKGHWNYRVTNPAGQLTVGSSSTEAKANEDAQKSIDKQIASAAYVKTDEYKKFVEDLAKAPGPSTIDSIEMAREGADSGDVDRVKVSLSEIASSKSSSGNEKQYAALLAAKLENLRDSDLEDDMDLRDQIIEMIDAIEYEDWDRLEVGLASFPSAPATATSSAPAKSATSKPNKVRLNREGDIDWGGDNRGSIIKRDGYPGYSLIIDSEPVKPPRGKKHWTKAEAHAAAQRMLTKADKTSEITGGQADLSKEDFSELSRTLLPRAAAGRRAALLKQASNADLQKLYNSVYHSYVSAAPIPGELGPLETAVRRVEIEAKRRGLKLTTPNVQLRPDQ